MTARPARCLPFGTIRHRTVAAPPSVVILGLAPRMLNIDNGGALDPRDKPEDDERAYNGAGT